MTVALDAPDLGNHFVSLIRLDPSHKEALRAAADEESIWTWMPFSGFGDHFDDYWSRIERLNETGNTLSFVIYDRLKDQIVGHSAYLEINDYNQRVEIGHTWYGRLARGGYVNPACKRLLLGRAFDWGAVRVELKTHARNERSRAAIKKMGGIEEGVLRSHMRMADCSWRDTVYFSVLKPEWPNVRQGLDARLHSFSGNWGDDNP